MNCVMTTEAPPVFGARRALLLFLAYVAAQFGTGIAAGIFVAFWYAATRGLRTPGVIAEAMRSATILGGIFGMIAGGWLIYRLVLRAAPRPQSGHRLAPFGWTPAASRPMLAALLIGAALGALCLVAMAVFPPPPGARPGMLGRSIAHGGWMVYGWALLAVAVAPPVEEFVFRGVIWRGLANSWGTLAAGTAVTALFVAMHLTEAWGNVPALVAITALGAATLWMRIATGSLVPPILLHAGYNGVLAVAVVGSLA
jgi:membrane protease YdiL (CAAX protease family)